MWTASLAGHAEHDGRDAGAGVNVDRAQIGFANDPARWADDMQPRAAGQQCRAHGWIEHRPPAGRGVKILNGQQMPCGIPLGLVRAGEMGAALHLRAVQSVLGRVVSHRPIIRQLADSAIG